MHKGTEGCTGCYSPAPFSGELWGCGSLGGCAVPVGREMSRASLGQQPMITCATLRRALPPAATVRGGCS